MYDKVVVIGSLNYDVCLKLERLPEEGETNFADSVEYCSGGKGANQAVQAAKLGIPVYMAGCIGEDSSGDFLKKTVEGYGVRTDYLKRVPGNSGMSVAQSLYDGGIRASVVRGANDCVTREDIDALADVITSETIVVFQLEIPIDTILYAIDLCREKGAFIILNGAPAAALPEETLRKLDLFIVNEVEASFYGGVQIDSVDTAKTEIRKMVQRLGTACIFTLGKAGSVVCDGSRTEMIPSKKVQAVESAGAGDSFIGGLCYALVKEMDLYEACRFATCCSAKTVCKTGGQPAMPTLAEVLEIYEGENT